MQFGRRNSHREEMSCPMVSILVWNSEIPGLVPCSAVDFLDDLK